MTNAEIIEAIERLVKVVLSGNLDEEVESAINTKIIELADKIGIDDCI